MAYFILYQLKVAVCISVFTAIYYILFRKDTFHEFNRYYLVFSMASSLILPMIHISSFQDSRGFLPVVVNTVTVAAGKVATPGMHSGKYSDPFSLVYLIIAIVLAAYLLIQLCSLVFLISRNTIYAAKGYKLVILAHGRQSFSFFNLIFIHPAVKFDDNYEQLICHELLHVRQFHTLDVLFVQLLKIVQWFNPFIYLLEKLLKETHEYLADKAVLEQNNQPDEYKLLLLAQVFGVQPGIFSFFNHSLIKNRLSMMTKQKSPPRNRLKYLVALPLTCVLAMMICCKPQKAGEATKSTSNPAVNQALNEQDPAYSFVDEQAEFQGGDIGAFRDWVQKNLVYPPEAVKNGVSGRVIVQFAVNASGKLVDIKVLRSADPMLGEEATHVLASSPDWAPAKVNHSNVKQQFVMPVVFALN